MDTQIIEREETAAESRKFIARVYGWMAFALLLSGISAFLCAFSEPVLNILYGNGKLPFYILFGVELVLVIVLSACLQRLPVIVAGIFFILYSLVNGATLSVIFMIYQMNSIFLIFFITAAMFLAMTIYGFCTKQDLTSAGRYLAMALFGVIIASIVNIFLKSSIFEWITTLVALVVFIGLTAYDTQKISRAAEYAADTDTYKKASIYGALQLYLDFINIFLKLLSLFGKKRR